MILTFWIVFFVNFPAMLESCNWYTCPDFIKTDFVSWLPNFYTPAGCGWGITKICWEASWSISMLIEDIVIWMVLNLIVYLTVYTFRKRK